MSEEMQDNQSINDEQVSFSDDEKGGFDEVMSKKVDTLFAQKDHWREKAKKAQEELQALRANKPQQESSKEGKPKKAETQDDYKERFERLELKQSYPDLSYELIDQAHTFAGVQGKGPSEVIASDFFSGYLKSEAEKKRAAEATPSPSNRSGSSSTDFSKVKPGDIAGMSKETYAKYKDYLRKQDSHTGVLNRRSNTLFKR